MNGQEAVGEVSFAYFLVFFFFLTKKRKTKKWATVNCSNYAATKQAEDSKGSKEVPPQRHIMKVGPQRRDLSL